MNTGYINLAPVDGKQFDHNGRIDMELVLVLTGALLALSGWWPLSVPFLSHAFTLRQTRVHQG